MQYILYTSSRSRKVRQDALVFAEALSETKGRGKVTVEVVYKQPPRKAVTFKDEEGDIKPRWEWLRQYFPVGDYDGVMVHFTDSYRKKYGLKSDKKGFLIGGSRNPDNVDYPEFWICTDVNKPAIGYPPEVSNLLRLLFHEHGHYDEDIDNAVGDKLTQDSVHLVDYQLKKAHLYHLLIDYRGQAIKQGVKKVTNQVSKL